MIIRKLRGRLVTLAAGLGLVLQSASCAGDGTEATSATTPTLDGATLAPGARTPEDVGEAVASTPTSAAARTRAASGPAATPGTGPTSPIDLNAPESGHPSGWLPAAPGTRGVTDTEIKVGMLDADATAAFALTGAATGGGASADAFNFKEGNLAGIDAVNAIGGIAGRRVVPVSYTYNAANFFSASGRQREAQAACAFWTEDNDVFAFSGSTATDDTLSRCAAATKTPMLITNYHLRLTDVTIRSIWDYYYEPADPSADRFGRAFGSFFVQHGWLERGAKVGLMIEDMPDEVQGAAEIEADLVAAGVELVAEIRYPDQIDSPWDSYVLQLQAAGVTHVLWAIQSSQVFPAVFMMQAAENQRYRPTWGLGSDMNLGGLLAFNGPPEQLRNVRAMGWLPVADVADDRPEAVGAEHAQICDEFARKRNQTVGYPRTQCEWLFFLRAAFHHADEVSPAGLAAGAAAMGGSHRSVLTIDGHTDFSTRHDGVSTVRPVGFDPASGGFTYTGPPEPLPE